MPLKILPQINRQTKVEVLPVKILPPILENNEINSNLTTILQIKSSDNIYEKFPEYEYGKWLNFFDGIQIKNSYK